ncbi:ATP-binding protein [Sphaerimonospora thailandensis]|uniref:ATP-binding protein n=1 Tax=Sphaerimonospora thailandensis TaxID=795644 RepID=A0A8J3VZH0_9ACTN|nr:ATP-binding protein [Sphaerimonospora thailandensis]GIH71134.1 ATP-binding protein [Sphaerimonospora thailandensis]
MTADLAGPGAATAPSWLAAMFEQDDVAGPQVPPSVVCVLQGGSVSPALAREFTARTLRGWGVLRLVPDAQVVVSELVTNALRHAPHCQDPCGPPILLRLVNHVDSTGRFHTGCGVSDASERVPALTREPDLSAETGRGLHLVDALSIAWGWILTGSGKIVWALFDDRAR